MNASRTLRLRVPKRILRVSDRFIHFLLSQMDYYLHTLSVRFLPLPNCYSFKQARAEAHFHLESVGAFSDGEQHCRAEIRSISGDSARRDAGGSRDSPVWFLPAAPLRSRNSFERRSC